MDSVAALPISHRSILKVAIPIMLSNVTEPLIGVVNTAVIGQLPDAYYIGAIAIGSLIFSFLFWGFGFLRLSTGGLSAQAVGAGNTVELTAVIWRALSIAAVAGAALLLASPLIRKVAFDRMGGSPDVRAQGEIYFNYRIWSAPFALVNFCALGWFIGQGRAMTAFMIQIILNLTNMVLGALFVLVLGMKAEGVGLSALIAEISGAALGGVMIWISLRRFHVMASWAQVWEREKLLRTLGANGDIMIRTLCLVFAFAWFTSRGARAGDVIVAANAVLLNFFEVAAYLIDGFAYASEALVGQAVGAGRKDRFLRAVKLTSAWALLVGAAASAVIWLAGPWLIDAMTVNPDVRVAARTYLALASLTPLLGTICFQFDGIFTGAMATREMRNMMIVSLLIYLASWWYLERYFGNSGLWLSLCVFFAARAVSFASRMPHLTRIAFP